MKYQKFDNFYALRLDRGEEIVAALKDFCRTENIALGIISGIGATSLAVLGLFNVETKQYVSRELSGNFEIASLAGNLTTMAGDAYLHLHAVLGDENQNTYAGHLTSALVSATCEIFITIVDGSVDRFFDEGVGLNLLKI